MDVVALDAGSVVARAGDELEFAYFPTTALLSTRCLLGNGATSEIASIGPEGMLGIELLLGDNTLSYDVVVQTSGQAFRLRSCWLKQESHRRGPMLQILLRYTQDLMLKMSQAAICGCHHTTEQRLCRWLLTVTDHSHVNDVTITQEAMAMVVGVRREAITDIARTLRHRKIIDYWRGHIRILDRPGMEARSCECYQILRHDLERAVGETGRRTPRLGAPALTQLVRQRPSIPDKIFRPI